MRLYFRIKAGQIAFGPGSLRDAATTYGIGDQNLAPHLASDDELRAIGVRWIDEPDPGPLRRNVFVSASVVAGEVVPVWSSEEDPVMVSAHNARQLRAKTDAKIASLRKRGDLDARVEALEMLVARLTGV